MLLNKKSINLLSQIVVFTFLSFSQGQSADSLSLITGHKLFESTDILPVKFKFSRKQVRRTTKDSTFMASFLSYKNDRDLWDTLDIKIKARGNFRRQTCYYLPFKVKIKKTKSKNTIFEGHKKLKVVLPCLNESAKDDNVIKEYIIYKMYEVITSNYFYTRLIDIEFDEIRSRKIKTHKLKGFFIEDVDHVAVRLNGKFLKRKLYPMAFDDLSAVRHSVFQYMIGNTDFSAAYSHNSKVFYTDKRYVPVFYDFDMSGFVNSSYSLVSQVRNVKLPIENVTQRYYRGYKRNLSFFKQVRREFLEKKEEIFEKIDRCKGYFKNKKSYTISRQYIEDFFNILANESEFYKNTYHVAKSLQRS